MLMTEREQMRAMLEDLTLRHGRDRTALLPILQAIQKSRFGLSDYAMQLVADLLQIHPVEVHSVVSFYSFLDTHPKGEFVIRLCRTISCDMADKQRVARQLENDLGIGFGQTTADGKFTLEWANCIGMCDRGPALLVNDRVYTRVTADKVHRIIEDCRRSFGPHVVSHKEAPLS